MADDWLHSESSFLFSTALDGQHHVEMAQHCTGEEIRKTDFGNIWDRIYLLFVQNEHVANNRMFLLRLGWLAFPNVVVCHGPTGLGLFLWGPRESGTLQFNSNFPVYSPNGHRTSLSTRQDAPTNNAQVKPWESKRDFPDYYTNQDISYLWVGQILPS